MRTIFITVFQFQITVFSPINGSPKRERTCKLSPRFRRKRSVDANDGCWRNHSSSYNFINCRRRFTRWADERRKYAVDFTWVWRQARTGSKVKHVLTKYSSACNISTSWELEMASVYFKYWFFNQERQAKFLILNFSNTFLYEKEIRNFNLLGLELLFNHVVVSTSNLIKIKFSSKTLFGTNKLYTLTLSSKIKYEIVLVEVSLLKNT